MSSQPPANSQPPPHGKDPWRLRGVHRAEPHLGEEDQSPRIIWAIVAGVVFVLAIIGIVFFIQSGPSSAIPTSLRTPTSPSPIATLGSATQSSVPTNLPAPSTATATAARPTAPVVRYRVRAGDTLSEIAQKYNVTVRAIMLANGLRNETIIEGEELIIPSATPRP